MTNESSLQRTITVTETVNPEAKRDLGSENPRWIENRQATATTTTITMPQNVPAYASPCSGTARYSSACSCAGVTPVTITAPTPTVTATVIECNLYGTKCNGICRDLFYDKNNCGTCGNVVGHQPSLPILSSPTTTNYPHLLTPSTTHPPVPYRQPMSRQMPLP